MIKKLILILLTFTSTILLAQENDQYLVSSKTLNVRNGAGKDYRIITTLNQNEAISVLDKNENGWWKIEFDEDEGYVFSELLKINPDSGWDKKKIRQWSNTRL